LARQRAAIVSFRLGWQDGVSVEAAKWAGALTTLGYDVRTVAGGGVADVVVPGLDINDGTSPSRDAVARELEGADVVIVENLCSLPLNPAACDVVADVLRGRRAVMRHHDLPWQHARFADFPAPPDDPAWVHVTINELSRRQLSDHGISAAVVRNRFQIDGWDIARDEVRAVLGAGENEWLVLQPTRAIARKRVPVALALAEALGGHFWLLGPTEQNYEVELEPLLAAARVPVHRGDLGRPAAHAYSACDLVAFPSSWEGFGNPVIEAALARKPIALSDYPVLAELRPYGFKWFDAERPEEVRAFLQDPDSSLLEHNRAIAVEHFDLAALPSEIASLFRGAGWSLPR
jgi:glycosyltransferase involved in cell wall biosynthesis